MALDGPMFSHLLLLAIYISGLRFSPNIPQEERESKASRFMGIVNNMIVEELSKPSSIPTARTWSAGVVALTTRSAVDAGRAAVLGGRTHPSVVVHRAGMSFHRAALTTGHPDDPGCKMRPQHPADASSGYTSR
jgi:hypothetical protein